jgi:hypothetical protein
MNSFGRFAVPRFPCVEDVPTFDRRYMVRGSVQPVPGERNRYCWAIEYQIGPAFQSSLGAQQPLELSPEENSEFRVADALLKLERTLGLSSETSS